MIRDIMDLHTHTIASGHAYNTILEMAQAASDQGLELLGITEHGELLVETPDGIRNVDSGEVSVRGIYGYV